MIALHVGDEPVWMPRARREIGVKETPGAKHSARILEYHNATRARSKADEIHWCSAYACWVFEGVGISSTRSAAARSWVTWGRGLTEPCLGCVTVLDRRSPDNPNAAHVAFYLGRSDETPPAVMTFDETLTWIALHVGSDGKHLILLGGNQKNRVCVQAYDPGRVLAYRWPDV